MKDSQQLMSFIIYCTIKGLLSKGNEEIKKDLETLISGGEIKKIINDNIVMTELEDSSENL